MGVLAARLFRPKKKHRDKASLSFLSLALALWFVSYRDLRVKRTIYSTFSASSLEGTTEGTNTARNSPSQYLPPIWMYIGNPGLFPVLCAETPLFDISSFTGGAGSVVGTGGLLHPPFLQRRRTEQIDECAVFCDHGPPRRWSTRSRPQ